MLLKLFVPMDLQTNTAIMKRVIGSIWTNYVLWKKGILRFDRFAKKCEWIEKVRTQDI